MAAGEGRSSTSGMAAALSVSVAVLLLLELASPFSGIIKVSSAPLQFALENVNR